MTDVLNDVEYMIAPDRWIHREELTTVRDVILKDQIKLSRECVDFVLFHAPRRRVGTEAVYYSGLVSVGVAEPELEDEMPGPPYPL